MENSSESRQRGSKKGDPFFESGPGFDTSFFAVSNKAFVQRDWTNAMSAVLTVVVVMEFTVGN